MCASLRVGSIVWSARRATPSALARRVKSVSSGARAATIRRSALAPSTTNDFSPWSVQPILLWRASSAIPPASQRPFGSATASAASVSPRAIPGRSAAFCASLPAFRTAFAPSAIDPKYGAHRSARPISSQRDAELDEAGALPSVRLRDGDTGQCQLERELLPHRGLVALGRVHEPPHLADRRLLLEEAPHDPAQLFLLFREAEPHAPILHQRASRWRVGGLTVHGRERRRLSVTDVVDVCGLTAPMEAR